MQYQLVDVNLFYYYHVYYILIWYIPFQEFIMTFDLLRQLKWSAKSADLFPGDYEVSFQRNKVDDFVMNIVLLRMMLEMTFITCEALHQFIMITIK